MYLFTLTLVVFRKMCSLDKIFKVVIYYLTYENKMSYEYKLLLFLLNHYNLKQLIYNIDTEKFIKNRILKYCFATENIANIRIRTFNLCEY